MPSTFLNLPHQPASSPWHLDLPACPPACPPARNPANPTLIPHPSLQGGHVSQRRALVCAYLGLGDCDGKQLARQLNRYSFGVQEVEAALRWAEAHLEAH